MTIETSVEDLVDELYTVPENESTKIVTMNEICFKIEALCEYYFELGYHEGLNTK